MYSRDVVFREVKDVIQHEVQPKEPEKIEFEPKEEESDSAAEEESEDEEPQTPAVRRSVRERRKPERYSPSAFSSNFALSYLVHNELGSIVQSVHNIVQMDFALFNKKWESNMSTSSSDHFSILGDCHLAHIFPISTSNNNCFALFDLHFFTSISSGFC